MKNLSRQKFTFAAAKVFFTLSLFVQSPALATKWRRVIPSTKNDPVLYFADEESIGEINEGMGRSVWLLLYYRHSQEKVKARRVFAFFDCSGTLVRIVSSMEYGADGKFLGRSRRLTSSHSQVTDFMSYLVFPVSSHDLKNPYNKIRNHVCSRQSTIKSEVRMLQESERKPTTSLRRNANVEKRWGSVRNKLSRKMSDHRKIGIWSWLRQYGS